MKKVFSIPISDVNISEINNGDFLLLKIYALSNGVNKNNSEFLEEGFEESIKTIYNKPILAYYNRIINDVEEHNSMLNMDFNGEPFYDYDYDGAEKPVGVIPESANIYVEEKDGKKWVVIENGFIWTEYNFKLTNLLKKQITKKVSVEIEPVHSYLDEFGIERIKTWKFLGITILGKNKDGSAVEEGIEGAKLVLDGYENTEKFITYKKKFNYAVNNMKYTSDVLKKYNISFEEEKKYISVDKSKESVSNDSWGDIDKTKIREIVLNAKNSSEIVRSVYLDVQDGWEESPSEKLKYPVMQYKNDKFVYNSNALLSAQQYGEKYDKNVAKKAFDIRKKLGLIKTKKEETMETFVENARNNGFVYIGTYKENMMFAKEAKCEENDKDCCEKMFVVEVPKTQCSCEEDFNWETAACKEMSFGLMFSDEEDGEDEEEEEDDEDEEIKKDIDDKEKEEMSKKIEKLEKDNEELNKRCETAEKELKDIKMAEFVKETDAVLESECDCFSEDEKEEIKKMRDDCKFANIEEFTKEVAYRKYLADKKDKVEMSNKHLSFGIGKNNKENPSNKNSLMERLNKI